jgi:transposase
MAELSTPSKVAMPAQWCSKVMRSKAEPKKQVATMITTYFESIITWARSRQTKRLHRSIN